MESLPSPRWASKSARYSRYQAITFFLLFLCSIYFTYSLAHLILKEKDSQALMRMHGFDSLNTPSPPSTEELLLSAKKGADGNVYPPSHLPKAANAALRRKAGFIVLVRNRELKDMKKSMKQVESRFNHKFGYPWIFLNDEPFTEAFMRGVESMTTSEVRFGQVPREHWSYPDWISEEKAEETRLNANYIYGHSTSYRHMCRFQSGFFFRHPLTLDLVWYWRVEPGIEIRCDIDYDPFIFMEMNNKTYGFTVAAHEGADTVPTLYDTTKQFLKEHPSYINNQSALQFVTDAKDVNSIPTSSWNLCHFWSNFEIADLRFWRSKEYLDYFNYLDKAGGFFYERWGDAPVHSLAASLFLDKSKLHHFDDIGYYHKPWDHCPTNPAYHQGRCDCSTSNSFDHHSWSCLKQWWAIAPEGTPDYVVPRNQLV